MLFSAHNQLVEYSVGFHTGYSSVPYIIQIYSGITRDRVLNGELLYT